MSESRESGEVSGAGAVNEGRVSAYRRLMRAQQQIAERLAARGVADERFGAALDVATSDPGADDCDIYLAELSRYVAALGGHLELRAVFPEDTIVVLRSDAPSEGPR